MTALRSPLAESCSEMLEKALMIIVNLTKTKAENRVKLGEYGACQGASLIFGKLERLRTTSPTDAIVLYFFEM